MKRILFSLVIVLIPILTKGQSEIVSPFDGSSSYSVSLGAGINMSYSSGAVPQIMTRYNRERQTSWVGAGWSLEMPSIEVDHKGSVGIANDQYFYLDGNGGRTEILRDSTGTYRLQTQMSWKVLFDTTSLDSEWTLHVTGITVIKEDGSKLRFGDFQKGVGSKKANRCKFGFGEVVTDLLIDRVPDTIAYRWDLSQMLDPYDVPLIDYYYFQEQQAVTLGGTTQYYTRASYIDHITNLLTGQNVVFVRGARDSAEYENTSTTSFIISTYETKYLDSIKIYSTASSSVPIQSWNLDYQLVGTGNQTKRLLSSVTQLDAFNRSLPSRNFTYDSTKQYILSSVLDPSGGNLQVTSLATGIPYLSQSTNATIIASQQLQATDSVPQVSASGHTVAIYYPHNNQENYGAYVRVQKWIGEWKSWDLFPDYGAVLDSAATLQVSDDHILLVYQYYDARYGNVDRLNVFDYREDTQQWILGVKESAFGVAAPWTQTKMSAAMQLLIKDHLSAFGVSKSFRVGPIPVTPVTAGMSPSGTQIALIVGSATSQYSQFQVIQWQARDRKWTSISDTDYNHCTMSFAYSPSHIFVVSDNMAFMDISNGTSSASYLIQWIYDAFVNRYVFYGQFLDNFVYGAKNEYSFQDSYIARWDKLYNWINLYILNGPDVNGAMDTVQQYFYFYQNVRSVPAYSDERVLMCERIDTTHATLFISRRDGSTFTSPDTIQNVAVQWFDQFDMKAQISNDWIFLLNHRNGILSPPAVEASLIGFRWNKSTGKYESAGSYNYVYASTNCGVPFSSTELTLTDDFVTIQSKSSTDCDSSNFTDVFKLDRNNPTAWSSNRTRLFTSGTGAKSCRQTTLIGANFIGTHNIDSGKTQVKFYHGVDKNWSDTISYYKVSKVVASDGMGKTVKQIFTYDSAPTFDPSLSFASHGWTTTAKDSSGYSTTWFKRLLSQPRLVGLVDSVKNVKQDSTTTVQASIPTWTVYQDPHRWYFYQIRNSAETNILDGVSTTKAYSYNDVNGQVSQIRNYVGVTSDSGQRDKVTRMKFAFEQYPAMLDSNMLSQVYESSDSSVGTGLTSVLLSRKQIKYSPDFRPDTTVLWNGATWDTIETVVSRNPIGNVKEAYNIDKVRSATKWGWDNTLPTAQIQNATDTLASSVDFEDGTCGDWSWWNTGSSTSTYRTGQKGWFFDNNYYGHITKNVPSAILGSVTKFTVSGWVKTAIAASVKPNFLWYIKYNNGASEAYPQAVYAAGNGKWEFLQMQIDLSTYSNIVELDIYARNGDNATWSQCTWDDIRFYPSNAFVTTFAYDPNTLNLISKTDANNVTSYTSYDGFGRPAQEYNDDRQYLSQQSTFYSREAHSGNFLSSDPNFKTSITYTSKDGYNDFSSAAGWQSSGDVTFNIPYQGENTVRLGMLTYSCEGGGGGQSPSLGGDTGGMQSLLSDSSGDSSIVTGNADSLQVLPDSSGDSTLINGGGSFGQESSGGGGGGTCYADGYINKPGGAGNIVARVDFYPTSSSGLPIVLAFHSDSPTYRFGVRYLPVEGRFLIQVNKNDGSGYVNIDAFPADAPKNQWYTIEIEKTSDGKCSAWYYSKGSARNYARMYSTSGYPTNWNAGVWSWSSVNYIYLANHYVGTFSQSTTYTDGLGRPRQTQVRDSIYDNVTAVEYDTAGRQYRTWRAFRQNTNHSFDSLFASEASSIFGISNPYAQVLYYPDPLSRAHYNIPVGALSTNEYIESRFSSAKLDGSAGTDYFVTDLLRKPRNDVDTTMTARHYRDKLGRVVKSAVYANATDPADPNIPTNQLTLSTYNMLGQVVSSSPPLATVPASTAAYDTLGRLTSNRTPDAGSSLYKYDRAGRLRFMIDSTGGSGTPASSTDTVLYWKYDLFGRVIEKGYIVAAWNSVSQSNANDPTYPTTPATWRKQYTYDDLTNNQYARARLTKVLTNNNADVTAEVEEMFTFDKYGNAVKVTCKSITYDAHVYSTNYEYDHLGRVTKISYPTDSVTDSVITGQTYTSPNTYSVSVTNTISATSSTVNAGAFAYYTAGAKITLGSGFTAKSGSYFQASLSSNPLVVYSYNQQGQVSSVGTAANPTLYASYTYTPDGRFASESLNNDGAHSKTSTFRYFGRRGELTNIVDSLFSDSLTYIQYGYGGSGYYDGSIASEVFSYAGSPYSFRVKYLYDNLGRLKVADNETFNAEDMGVTTPASYDKNGNILSMQKGTTPARGYSYSSGTNKVVSLTNPTATISYDRNGNVMSAGTTGTSGMSYDPFTQLTQKMSVGSVNASFEYGGAKKRVLKSVTSGAQTTKTLYLHGLNDYPLMERVNTGGSISTKYYIYGPSGLLAINQGGALYYVLKDHLGSTRVVFNGSDGSRVEWNDYLVYGGIAQNQVNPNIHYKFTGQEYEDDIASNLHNYRARFYDSELRRFYATDPTGEGFSPYSYALNNPLLFVDPTGLMSSRILDDEQTKFKRHWNPSRESLEWDADFSGEPHYMSPDDFEPSDILLSGGSGPSPAPSPGTVPVVPLPGTYVPPPMDLHWEGLPIAANGPNQVGSSFGGGGGKVGGGGSQILPPIHQYLDAGAMVFGSMEFYVKGYAPSRIIFTDVRAATRWVPRLSVVGGFKILSERVFVASAFIDYVEYLDGEQSLEKTIVNIGMSGIALTGPIGLLISSSYYLLDANGAFDGFGDYTIPQIQPFGVPDATQIRMNNPRRKR